MNYSLEEKISQLMIVGFRGKELRENANIVKILEKYDLGGVWLTDKDSPLGQTEGNIKNADQVRKLTADLQEKVDIPLFISIDAEGGEVIRLKQDYGFPKTYSPKTIGKRDDADFTRKEANKIAKLLDDLGINFNFAPVLDLDLYPDNPALGGKKRCLSDNPAIVCKHAEIFIREHRKRNIICCGKHFPGHGSARDDSHAGLVEVSEYWDEVELLPYKYLNNRGLLDSILTAHIHIKQLDEENPATLSHKIINNLLRDELDYSGLVISDDLDMHAIHNNYSLRETVKLALQAGVDILDFSNLEEYDPNQAEKVINTIKDLVQENIISENRIDKSFQRIIQVKSKYLD